MDFKIITQAPLFRLPATAFPSFPERPSGNRFLNALHRLDYNHNLNRHALPA